MNAHPDVIEAIDQIDAAIFSGDTFLQAGNNKEMTGMVERWLRGLKEHLETIVEMSEKERGILPNGTRIRTLKEKHSEQYTEEAQQYRKWNVEGTVEGYHDSHGVCYDVKLDIGGIVGCFDPDEIEEILNIDIINDILKGVKKHKSGAVHQLYCSCCGRPIMYEYPFWTTEKYTLLESCGKRLMAEKNDE